ncbi:MAG: TIGR04290 family methyltransferase [Acidobacteriia bacterium]|nr:TIGR04290 family methyltransferase [Terriglobia bacterium]
MRRQWSQEEIRQRIHELGQWFHNLNLCGIETAPDHFLGDYPSFKWRAFERSLPADLSGMTVLDVGCNAGFFSLEMKKRGAGRVVGIDTDDGYLEQARFAAQVCGADIEFRQMSVYEVARLREKFDIVLYTGVSYHLRHPLLALDLLHEFVVRDLLVFQSLLRGSTTVDRVEPDYPFAEADVFNQSGYPKMHFVEDRFAGDPTNWWIPNLACAEAMLRSAGFTIVEHPELEVFICRRAANTVWAQEESGALLRSLKGGVRS